MSRKLVLVGFFSAVLLVLMVSVKAWADDPFSGSANGKSDGSKPQKANHCLTKPKPHSDPKLHCGEEAILKALKQKASLEFTETPLKEAVDFLSEMHHIPIRLDSSALKEAGVDDVAPVTCKLSSVPLRSALEIILDDLQLKWVIRHDVLTITSPTKAESDEYMYTKCYDVTDLLATAKDYELQNPLSPIKESQQDYPVYGGTFGMGGGMSRMATESAVRNGRSICCGVAPLPCGCMQPALNDAMAIKDALTNAVATKTWMENGGTGNVSEYDRMLVITQTREVHLQIEQFLADLRANRNAVPTLSLQLHWLWLDAQQRDRLLGGQGKSPRARLSLAVDPRRLWQIAREVPGFHAQVACLNGIRTAIAAGDRRSIILLAIPVVGGDGIGYMPVISLPNVGVTAQIRPTVVPGTKSAMLDITSIITRWDPARKPVMIGAAWPADKQVIASNPGPTSPPGQNPAKPAPGTLPSPGSPIVKTHTAQGGSASCPVDQPVMPTQQIGAALRVPLGKPVIVGSITFASEGNAGLGAAEADSLEVYLIATTSVVRGASK